MLRWDWPSIVTSNQEKQNCKFQTDIPVSIQRKVAVVSEHLFAVQINCPMISIIILALCNIAENIVLLSLPAVLQIIQKGFSAVMELKKINLSAIFYL